MSKLIPLLLLTFLLASCGAVSTAPEHTLSAAAQQPTMAPNTPQPFSTAPTDVPPTFYYTPPPTETPPTHPVETPTPMGTPKPEDYEVFALQMVDKENGWAVFNLGFINEADFWLGYTSDGAQTWRNVTPPAFDALHTGTLSYSTDTIHLKVYALDANTAWAYTSCNTAMGQCHVPSALWRTEDGGRSWRTLHVPIDCISEQVDCVPYSLQFVDLEHGWLLMALVERNYTQFDFYRTSDGGETWKTMPRLEASRNVQVMNRPTFFDEQFGWRLPPSYISDPFEKVASGQLITLDISYDGGYSWLERALPVPNGFGEALEAQSLDADKNLSIQFSRVADPANTGALILRIDYHQGSWNTPLFFHAIYFSRDRGLSWKALSQVGDTFYLDQETGWRLTDSAGILEQTTDGGTNWQPYPRVSWNLEYDSGIRKIVKLTEGGAVKTSIPTRFLNERLWPGQALRLTSLHMQNALEGWGEEIGGAALCTTDGARTWQPCPAPPDESAILSEARLADTEGTYFPAEPLPEEMFHGEPVPAALRGWIEQGREFLPEITLDSVFGNPFAYFCKTQHVDWMGGDRAAVSRSCSIRYPTEVGRVYIFLTGYWMYYYTTLIQDGEQQVWPNVVDLDFIEEDVGWRLFDQGTGQFQLGKTENGGDSWRPVKDVAWIGQLEFVNAQEGWAIALEPPERGVSSNRFIIEPMRPSALLHTTDGGRTWQEIVPVVGG
jgi:photosystem II stability/assembly factor-like uncharacterized protein